MNKKMVITRSGYAIVVDTSDEVCRNFGFKHGDRILNNSLDEKGTIMGVATCAYSGNKVLWYALDIDNGRVSYSRRQKLTLISS